MQEYSFFFSLYPVSLVIVTIGVVNLILGLIVFLKDISGISNRVFLLFILAVATWISGLLVIFETSDRTTGLDGLRLAFAGAALIAPAFTHFAVTFPQRARKIPGFFLPLLYVTGLLLSTAALFTDGIVTNIVLLPFGYRASYGLIYPVFGIYFIGSMSAALWIIFYKYKSVAAENKVQMRFFLIGAIATVICTTTTNFIVPALTGVSLYSRYGPFGMMPFIFLTSYAIIRHNLLNIRVITAELFTFAVVFTLFIRFVLSQDRQDVIFNSVILVSMVVFGFLLIKSVLKEVRSREKITELAVQLQKSNDELKKLDQAKSEFISIASHQLRAPLTIIRGYISLMLEGTFGVIQDSGRDALSKVSFSAEQLVKLVSDLLNLSRIESGKIRYEFKPMNFAELIERVVGEFRPSAEGKGKEIIFQNSAGEILLNADPDKIREVAVNLIDNAVKYSSKTIQVKLEKMQDTAHFSVHDDGIGIGQDDIKKLFVKFSRTIAAEKADPNGMGIGLYFVKRVVEDHKGRVWVESEGTGKGSTFVVELPLHQR